MVKRVVLIGAGLRGLDIYGTWLASHPEAARVTAVAEPDPLRRSAAAKLFSLGEKALFPTYEELLQERIPADIALICTQDRLHAGPAVAAMEIGYDVILEKPLGVTEEECERVYRTAKQLGRKLYLCHVLRYTGFFSTVKRSIASGLIGEIIHIEQAEHVTYWHFSHSYVRGNWRREADSSPVVIAKCCHDIDIISWLLDDPVISVASTGALTWYTGAHAPAGAPPYCLDGCPEERTCPWYAPRVYRQALPLVSGFRHAESRLLRAAGTFITACPEFVRKLCSRFRPLRFLSEWDLWPATAVTTDLTAEGKLAALKDGPYGRCVYRCDNDVPDHQVVMMQTAGGKSAVLTMEGHSYLEGRWIRIDGSAGTLEGWFTMAGERLWYFDHRDGKKWLLWEEKNTPSGHGGGDIGLMESIFLNHEEDSTPTLEELLVSYRIGFAAERARKEGRIVPIVRS